MGEARHFKFVGQINVDVSCSPSVIAELPVDTVNDTDTVIH